MPKKPVTQADIANRLGLARTTVSKILNGSKNCYVSQLTRERVFAMAKKPGFEFIPRRTGCIARSSWKTLSLRNLARYATPGPPARSARCGRGPGFPGGGRKERCSWERRPS